MPRRRNEEPDFTPLIESSLRQFIKLSRRNQIILLFVLAIGIASFFAYVHWKNNQQRPSVPQPTATTQQSPEVPTVVTVPPALSPDLLLGNPSNATTDPANRANYLMVKPFYSLSYNSTKGIPNWVSWRVTFADLGTAPRKQTFDPDSTLPPGFTVITHRDYTGSGFDRGHMCPHSDRAANTSMSYETFVMSNIIPQAPNVNQKAWAQEEDYCRQMVRQHFHLYTIAGPAGQGGIGKNGPAQTVAQGRVVVPAECWKVVLMVPEAGGDDDLAKINSGTRVLTVDMPNDNSAVGEEWAQYRTSVAEIERKTGYRFFDRLRPAIAAALRAKVDTDALPTPQPYNRGDGN